MAEKLKLASHLIGLSLRTLEETYWLHFTGFKKSNKFRLTYLKTICVLETSSVASLEYCSVNPVSHITEIGSPPFP